MQNAAELPLLGETASYDDLIQNDLLVVEMYRDLARRHAELVDWVEKQMRRVNGAISK